MKYDVNVIDREQGKVAMTYQASGQLDGIRWLIQNETKLQEADKKHPGRYFVDWVEMG